jgi:hypothetical protein
MNSKSPALCLRRGAGRVQLLLIALAVLLICQRTNAQLSYSSGQSVSPAFEGWMQNDDGTADFLFGYMNSNWEEELDVPIGPDNNIDPAGPDQGQPTHFLPRRNRFIFRVRVPKDFAQREMVWTLTTHGKTIKAYASLKTDYLVENIDIMSETGALGAGTSSPEVRADKPPVIKLDGARTRTAKAGQPMPLVAWVTDDGVPKTRGRGQGGALTGRGGAGAAPAGAATPSAAAAGRNPIFNPPTRVTVGKTVGLHLSWFVYRSAGKVSFDPPQVKVWEDTRTGANSPWAPLWSPPPVPEGGKYETQVTFDEPGTYVLRGRADDGALFSDEDVTVNVTR